MCAQKHELASCSPHDAMDEETDVRRLSALSKITPLRSSRGKTQTQVPLKAKVLKTFACALPCFYSSCFKRQGSLTPQW